MNMPIPAREGASRLRTKIFDYSKHEVSNFLIANALYWADKYHIDGGCGSTPSPSMPYLDYGKEGRGSGFPTNTAGMKIWRASWDFPPSKQRYETPVSPSSWFSPENPTAWPKITDAPEDGGLGFTFKMEYGLDAISWNI